MMKKLKEIANSILLFIGVIGTLGIVMYFGVTILVGLIPIMLIVFGISAVVAYLNRDKIKELNEKMAEELSKTEEVKDENEPSDEVIKPKSE